VLDLQIFFTDRYVIPLPDQHTFPISKYARLRDRILASRTAAAESFHIPAAAAREDILRAHDPLYLRRFEQGRLTRQEMRRVGLPWSPELVERTKRSVGGTLAACRAALVDGVAVNLGGGTHHAFRDAGQGYCLLNDSVIAARALQAERRLMRVLIIDCDVHQGNGTAALVHGDPDIFAFSIHGRNNFPHRKEAGDLDIALPDGTGDKEYLEALRRGLSIAGSLSHADLAIYLAGADPFEKDRFGRLALSRQGLAVRDRIVFEFCMAAGLPVAVTMAGGYAPDVNDTVEIHLQTVKAAADLFRRLQGERGKRRPRSRA
jgi:acetoin utilization deacetylase AcuC-like enzyme